MNFKHLAFVLTLGLTLAGAPGAIAQVQNPVTTTPLSPENQCVPTHAKDRASKTAGSPRVTTVDSTADGSEPCQYNTPLRHKHRRHQQGVAASTSATPKP
jgi:hypothetical protein